MHFSPSPAPRGTGTGGRGPSRTQTDARRSGTRDKTKRGGSSPIPRASLFVLSYLVPSYPRTFVPAYSRTNSVTSRISTGPMFAARMPASTTERSPTITTTEFSGRTYVLATRRRSSALTAMMRCT